VSEVAHCDHCGAKVVEYWHKLTPGLVKALIKARTHVKDTGVNLFETNELELTHSELCNWSKLRHHGLVVKHFDSDKRQDGWLLSRRVGPFLRNELSVPAKVKTFRNVTIGHDSKEVFLRDIYTNDLPYFEDINSIERVTHESEVSNVALKSYEARYCGTSFGLTKGELYIIQTSKLTVGKAIMVKIKGVSNSELAYADIQSFTRAWDVARVIA